MRELTRLLIVGALLSSGVLVFASESQTDRPIRLSLDLIDGSVIKGTATLSTVRIHTTFARMEIPLEQIQRIEINEDHETGAFQMKNGDRITGAVDIEPITLQTIVGKVSIHTAQIESIRVVTAVLDLTALKPSHVDAFSFSINKVEDETKEVPKEPVLDGKTPRRYLWAHAPSRIVYDLKDSFAQFKARGYIGADTDNNQFGEVKFIVKVDGKVLYSSDPVFAPGSVEIVVDLPKKAKRLELVIDPLGSFNSDHSFWLEPILKR